MVFCSGHVYLEKERDDWTWMMMDLLLQASSSSGTHLSWCCPFPCKLCVYPNGYLVSKTYNKGIMCPEWLLHKSQHNIIMCVILLRRFDLSIKLQFVFEQKKLSDNLIGDTKAINKHSHPKKEDLFVSYGINGFDLITSGWIRFQQRSTYSFKLWHKRTIIFHDLLCKVMSLRCSKFIGYQEM